MTQPLRWLFALEAAVTLSTGLFGLFDPVAFAGRFVSDPPTGASLDFVRWLMATYVVIGSLLAGLLWRGTREAWQIVLAPLLLGDALHLVAQGAMLSNGGLVDFATHASVLFTLVLAGARIAVLRRPELVAV